MRHLEEAHGVQVSLTVTPAGISATGGLSLLLLASDHSVVASGPQVVLEKSHRWPCVHHKEFWSCVYEGLYQMDYQLTDRAGWKAKK